MFALEAVAAAGVLSLVAATGVDTPEPHPGFPPSADGVKAAALELGFPLLAAGALGVGAIVLVMPPVGTGIVTVTVTGVAAQPLLQTVVVA